MIDTVLGQRAMIAITHGNDKLFLADSNGMYQVSSDQKTTTKFKSTIHQDYYICPNYDGSIMYYYHYYGSNNGSIILMNNVNTNKETSFYHFYQNIAVLTMYFYNASTVYIATSQHMHKFIINSDGTFRSNSIYTTGGNFL